MIGVLFQATNPPVIDGIRKPMKPTGYLDSAADIAHALRSRGISVVTPVADPDPAIDADWAYPDTIEGIDDAQRAGATILWANTVLFRGHPIETAIHRGAAIVGQRPEAVHEFDDKWHANQLLRSLGCPVARSVLVAADPRPGALALDQLSLEDLIVHGVRPPAIVKPLRGRGSAGVTRVDSLAGLVATARSLLAETVVVDGEVYPTYGNTLMVEEYLPSTEVTVTVMPPGTYRIDGAEHDMKEHWSLPPIERVNHVDGITPYNGVVAVTENSFPVDHPTDAMQSLLEHCAVAAAAVGAVAPIRIDCRARADGEFVLFDLNMKPNMTGAGRPGRDDQDSLSCMAARCIGWSFGDLLENMARQAWRLDRDATIVVS